MTLQNLFEFSAYHLWLAVIGAVIVLARWLPRLVSDREPAAAPLMILLSALAALIIPELPPVPDPRSQPKLWESASEICVIAALFGAGMRIDRLGLLKKWRPTLRLLVIAMPLTIAETAILGVSLGGFTLAGALLLGAVLSPTDPVLAADVQVGPPQEGEEHPVRFTLTTEATLNDGLAFPFVYLAMSVFVYGVADTGWLTNWLAIDVAYRIAVGTFPGWVFGQALGYLLFSVPGDAALAETGSGVVAIAGVFLCYGATELVEGYGFIAVAVMGLTLRRAEEDHHFHKRLHDFSESIEHALTALLLIALGAALPLLLPALAWSDIVLVVFLLVVVRPVFGWASGTGMSLPRTDRAVISVYGVRGIGSIYYLGYALGSENFGDADRLWAIVALTIVLSTMLHGFSVGWAMDQISRRRLRT
ncbi:cation:proton antiporter [Rhodophyticola sp.]|uniref:cation:proton antiporter n=1 Tax=Rhodophyticola sp. TaxID=2680032 RepID=UPI003D2DCDE3